MGSRPLRFFLRLDDQFNHSTAALRTYGAERDSTRRAVTEGCMRKFGAYPIVVNYNLHTRLRYQHKENDFHRAGRYDEERQLDIKVNTSSDSTIENNLYKQELNEYEQT